jgi:hypothetical protein
MAPRALSRHLPVGFAFASLCFSASTALSDGMDQAKAEAQRFIQSQFATRADGMAFSYEPPNPKEPRGYSTGTNYWQLDGFSWQVYEETPTHVDKLNGITWKGSIGANLAAYRSARESDGLGALNPPPCWRDWSSPPKWKEGAAYDLKWPSTHQRSLGNKGGK